MDPQARSRSTAMLSASRWPLRCRQRIKKSLFSTTTTTEARASFEVRNVSVSERTIRRRLAKRNLRLFRPARAPELL
jgi:hypothetical protein